MLNLSAISHRTMLGKLLRLPLRLLPDSMMVRVLAGPNRGLRWRVGSSIHGCWLGTYEAGKVQLVIAEVRPGAVAFDIGANAGYYSLALSRKVGHAGRVIAFEPFAENVASLLRHLEANSIQNCDIIAAAIGHATGLAGFMAGSNNSVGALTPERSTMRIPVFALDDLLEAQGLPIPDVVKMDIEGAEGAALRGATALLRRRQTVWFVSLHGEAQKEECLLQLRDAGYEVRTIGSRLVTSPTDLGLEDEIVARPRPTKASKSMSGGDP